MSRNCPKCDEDKKVIKYGRRHTKQGKIQKYFCKNCDHHFSERFRPHTSYPEKVILYALEQYNKGLSAKKAKALTGKKYRHSPPESTIYNWIERYKDLLTFLKLRKRFNIEQKNLLTTHTYNHQQVYPFKYHNLKLHLSAKDIPQLRRYISWVERSLPNKIFLKGPRASSTKIENGLKPKKKDNIAPKLAEKALITKKKTESKHEAVERFFLLNDSKTVCSELPVFIKADETELKDFDIPLTGHIDLIQVRFNKLYIMDYKSNLKRPETHTSQLLWYREAIHERTSLPKDQIIPAVFNEHGYYELQ